jgi:outer membrane protein assembly factor BamE (lipoprotein component of BamABCDE complex)
MKKSILLVSLFLAAAALAGCSHPTDLIDDVASVSLSAAQA